MSFNKSMNVLKGISNVVEATSKEEEIHGNFGVEIINIIKKENPEWFDDKFQELINSACMKAYKAECGVLDWIFEQGELSFLTKDTIQEFIKNRFNNSLNKIGYESIFDYDVLSAEQLDWFYHLTGGVTHTDFFAIRSTDYSKAGENEDYEDIW